MLRSCELESEIRLLTFTRSQALRLYSWLPFLITKPEAQGRLFPSPVADVTPFPGPEGSGAKPRLSALPQQSPPLCSRDESQVAGTALQLPLVPTCAPLPPGELRNCSSRPWGQGHGGNQTSIWEGWGRGHVCASSWLVPQGALLLGARMHLLKMPTMVFTGRMQVI